MTRVAVDFACNDPDNGSFAGKVFMASRSGNDLEADNWPDGYKFTDGGTFIRIHRCKFKVEHSKDWVGNWCWSRYWFSYSEYRRLIRTMAAHGWRCTGGLARWSDAFDALTRREPNDPQA